MDDLTCLNKDIGRASTCQGPTELRPSLSGTGLAIARCDGHWEARLRFQEELDRRYPVQAPADFDPLYAGERWDEED